MGIIYTHNGYPVQEDNPFPVVLEGPVQSISVSADNGEAIIELPAPPPGMNHYVWGIVAGYDGDAFGAVTIRDSGNAVETLPVNGLLVDNRTRPLMIPGALTVALSPSGDVGTTGYLTLRYETR